MPQHYLIIGASGTVGSEITRLLKAQGHQVRTTTGRPAAEAGQARIDLLSGEGFDAAFSDIDRAFFLSPGGHADQYQILAPLIRKAKAANLKKVVLMTALGVDMADGSPMRRAEQDLEASGLTYNIIRPGWFMQNFNTFWYHSINEQGEIRLPVGDAVTGFIDARDISAVAAKLLATDDLNNQAFTLTGPELLDHKTVARHISEASGKRITFVDIEPAEFKATLVKGGISESYADVLVMLMSLLKAGYTARLTDAVKKILGREPRDFKTYARDFAASWK